VLTIETFGYFTLLLALLFLKPLNGVKIQRNCKKILAKYTRVRQWNLQGPMEQIGVMGPYLLPLICDEIIEGYSPKITGSPKKFP